MKVKLKPIGVVHSPYEHIEKFPEYTVGEIEVFKEYEEGLKDIEGFSHLIVLWVFRKSKGYSLHVEPLFHTDKTKRGVFATRHPNRPNPIGLTIVELLERKGNTLIVDGIDMTEGTPIIDIKPYTLLDQKKDVRLGWTTSE